MSSNGRQRVRGSAALVLAVALVRLALPAQVDAKTDIKVDYDKMFSFAGMKTWTWRPDGKGDVRVAVSSQDDPVAIAARVDPVIIPSIEKEMTARGFVRGAEGVDMYVHYYALATVKQNAQIMGQFLPATTSWGLPPFAATTTSLEILPTGTLIIDVTSTAAQKIVWRGAAQRTINLERPDSERKKVLEEAIRDLLKRFPPKK